MFEFITVRELYEMFLSNQMMDLEGLGKGRCTQQFLPDKHPGELGEL